MLSKLFDAALAYLTRTGKVSEPIVATDTDHMHNAHVWATAEEGPLSLHHSCTDAVTDDAMADDADGVKGESDYRLWNVQTRGIVPTNHTDDEIPF